jgi:hypothetical protein
MEYNEQLVEPDIIQEEKIEYTDMGLKRPNSANFFKPQFLPDS